MTTPTESPQDPTDRIVAGPSLIHGTGVFAARQLRLGEHLGDYTGPRTEHDQTYVLWVEGDDGEFYGIDGDSVLRWLNHSPDPNVEFDGPSLYALRDIDTGEELTFHYGPEWEHHGPSTTTVDPPSAGLS